MQEYEAISTVIGDIYDAALRPETWPDVLSKVAHVTGSKGGCLISQDIHKNETKLSHAFGISSHYAQQYTDQYSKFDPTMMSIRSFPVGYVVSTIDLLPLEEFSQSPFYKEWVRPQGWVDALQIILEKSARNSSYISFFRDETAGIADARSIRSMKFIAPHLCRAMLIGKVIDRHQERAAAFVDTLDRVSAGIFLLDEARTVLHANASGHAMLASKDVLHVVDGSLSASTPQSDQTLRAIILAASQGDTAASVAGITQPLAARNGDPFVAHILPLTSAERQKARQHYAAQAVLFVHKAALQLHCVPEIIAKVFKLTPSEIRVLLAIVQVGGTPEIAEALGIGETTVRTHLQRVFAKTGISRQADLVKLVAEFSNPLTPIARHQPAPP